MPEEVVGCVAVRHTRLDWILPMSYTLPQAENIRIWSNKFTLSAISCTVLLCKPHINVPNGCLGLYIEINGLNFPRFGRVLVGLVDDGKKVINSCKARVELNRYGRYNIIVDDFCKKTSLNSSANYQLFCQIFNEEINLTENTSVNEDAAYESGAGGTAITNEGSADNFAESSSCQHDEDRYQKLENLEKLGDDLKELYITGQDADITIKVKDKEFKAHKAILRVRSSVFNAMFTHELSENKSNTIPIQDCDPDIFEEFLYFIYSGRIRNLTSENACELYYIADKYLIPELKRECIVFLKNNICIETICDVVYLSAKYKEAELLRLAELFFAKHMEEILVTVKWQLFMKENPTEANEISLKALRLGFTKKDI